MPPFRSRTSIAAAAAAASSFASFASLAYADGPFRFPYLSSPSAPATNANASSSTSSSSSSGGFDPESLERGAKALREINSSPYAHQVFELMRRQEESRLAEIAAEKARHLAIQTQADIVSLLCFGSLFKLQL
ncbi:ATPase family AAA domain-containing protein 3-like, partial [Phalaenopsis equestris]